MSTKLRIAVATVAFLALARLAAVKMYDNEVIETISMRCAPLPESPVGRSPPPHPNPYATTYTKISWLDGFLCVLNSIYYELLRDPDHRGRQYVQYFLATLGPMMVILPTLESVRRGSSWWLAFPAIVGILCQVFGAGIIIPLWCLLFFIVSSGGYYSITTDTHADPAKVEGLLVGLLLGIGLTASPIFARQDGQTLAMFHLAPMRGALFSLVWRGLRSFKPPTGPPRTIWLFRFAQFTSFCAHWGNVLSNLGSARALLIPSKAGSQEIASVADRVFEFIQWDGTVVFLSLALLSVLIARSSNEGVSNARHLFGYAAIAGPGAGLVAVWSQREEELEKRPVPASKAKI